MSSNERETRSVPEETAETTASKQANAAPSEKSEKAAAPKKSTRKRADAASMAAEQKEISVSEFFAKNRHLLGFDNPRKALLTTVKEAVDNSLDACEESGTLPEIWTRVERVSENTKPPFLWFHGKIHPLTRL